MFFAPILSGNNKRSCVSCHKAELAFPDGKEKSIAFQAEGSLSRNAPTLVNSAYQRIQFYDSLVMLQEDQVKDS